MKIYGSQMNAVRFKRGLNVCGNTLDSKESMCGETVVYLLLE